MKPSTLEAIINFLEKPTQHTQDCASCTIKFGQVDECDCGADERNQEAKLLLKLIRKC